MTEIDQRDYSTCPANDYEGTEAESCGEPVQITVERWGHVLDDGTLSFGSGVGASGGGMLRIYCTNDHDLGEHDLEPEDFTESGAVRADVVSQSLAEYVVTDRSRA